MVGVGLGEGRGELVFNGDQVSVWEDEHILETDGRAVVVHVVDALNWAQKWSRQSISH